MKKTLILTSSLSTIDLNCQKDMCEQFAFENNLKIVKYVDLQQLLNIKKPELNKIDLILCTCFVCFGDNMNTIIKNIDELEYKNPKINIFTIYDSENFKKETDRDRNDVSSDRNLTYEEKKAKDLKDDQKYNISFERNLCIICSVKSMQKHNIIEEQKKRKLLIVSEHCLC